MKKFLKSIFTILCLLLVALAASVFMLPKVENQTYAIDDNMHTVNFYDGNNLLYSIQVDNGKSLIDLYNNNLLSNPDFSINTGGQDIYNNRGQICVDNWTNWLFGSVQLRDYYLLCLNNVNSTKNEVVQQIVDIDVIPQNLTYSVCYFDINSNQFLIESISGNPYNYVTTNFSNGSISFGINSSGKLYVNLGVNQDSSMYYVWACLQDTSNISSYFSNVYINRLFKYYNDLTSNDIIYWSTAENVGQYNFDTPITDDLNLYGFEDLTFNDNAEQLEAEVSYQPSYYLLEKAINNIEYIHYKGAYNFKVSIDTSKLTQQVPFLYLLTSVNIASLDTSNTNNQQTYLSSMSLSYIGNYDFDILNFRVIGGDNPILCVLAQSLGVPLYRFYLRQNVGIVDFYFSQASITYNSSSNNYVYDDNIDKYVFYNGTDLNDMNSNTNYFLSLDNVEDYSYYQTFLDLLSGETPSVYMYYSEDKFNDTDKYLSLYVNQSNTSYSYDIYKSDLNDNMVYISQFSLIFDDNDVTSEFYATLPENCFTFDSGFSFTQFDIVVRKPVARVDNSLVIFNFGYNNFLNAVTQVKYELRRGINYFDVVYNGQLENSKMIVIDNEFVRNSLFDEYIFVSFLIDVDNLSSSDVVNGQIGTYLGFDFNFVYYTQPLIAGNASYDLMQYRPEYMDGTPSLFPLNIPFTAWIYNAFLWLIFDCPLISDILGFLHLQSFMGALLNIIDLYVNSGIGQFVLACLSFVIFWAILKSLMPALADAGRSIYSNTQFAYNRKRKKQDKINLKLSHKEKVYNSNQKIKNNLISNEKKLSNKRILINKNSSRKFFNKQSKRLKKSR